ncbi:transposase, partial [Burkholderia pseudomallei]
MKKSKFTEEQIAYALKQAELGTPVAEVCLTCLISSGHFNLGERPRLLQL